MNNFSLYNRRSFIKSAGMVSGGIILSQLPIEKSAYGAGSDQVKLAVVGCGGRGTGAVFNALKTKANVKLVAMAEALQDNLNASYHNITREFGSDKVDVPEENRFVGFEAYKKAIDLADVVILATPPAFRPQHFEYAVQKGKHVFMEKPLATDVPGIKKLLAAGKLADQKNLKVVVGLQNRYNSSYQQLAKSIHDGEIGEVTNVTAYYYTNPAKILARQPEQTEMEYQMRNWHYFDWLWGAAPAGIQIHNTDVVHWIKGSYPVKAQGMGGRISYNGPNQGHVYDHFFIEYTYDDGSKLNSMIRQMDNCFDYQGLLINGTNGQIDKRQIWSRWERNNLKNPYQVEQDVFFDAILNDKPINDTEYGALSTMSALLGRIAVYSGQEITWEQAFNTENGLVPDHFNWHMKAPIVPGNDGNYPVPVPGKTKVL